MAKKSFKDLFKTATYLLQRKAGIISHLTLKIRIVDIARRNLNSGDLKDFSSILSRKVNPFVFDLLKKASQAGFEILVATAAADYYMQAFKDNFRDFKFDVIDTKINFAGENVMENKGETKLRELNNYLDRNKLQLVAFLSDHENDLSLFNYYSCKRYLVNPSPKTLKIFLSKFKKVEKITTTNNNYLIS